MTAPLSSSHIPAKVFYRRAKTYISTSAVQLYMGGMFSTMAVLRLYETNDFTGGIWWSALYGIAAHLIAAGLIFSHSKYLTAATGAFIAMVAMARIFAVAGRTIELIGVDSANAARASVAILLWGLVFVVALFWPRVTFDSAVRLMLSEERPEPVDRLERDGLV